MDQEQRKQLETACEIVATAFATRSVVELLPEQQTVPFARLSGSLKDTLLKLVDSGFGGVIVVEQRGHETNWTNSIVGVGSPAGMVELALGAADLQKTAMFAALRRINPAALVRTVDDDIEAVPIAEQQAE